VLQGIGAYKRLYRYLAVNVDFELFTGILSNKPNKEMQINFSISLDTFIIETPVYTLQTCPPIKVYD
jgi:hypothetical protein